MRQLEALLLGRCSRLSDAALTALCVSSAHTLTEINLFACVRLTDLTLYAIAEHCHNLQCLYLSRCTKLSDAALTQVRVCFCCVSVCVLPVSNLQDVRSRISM